MITWQRFEPVVQLTVFAAIAVVFVIIFSFYNRSLLGLAYGLQVVGVRILVRVKYYFSFSKTSRPASLLFTG